LGLRGVGILPAQARGLAPTLVNKDKIPYGTYVLYDQLPRLLGTDSVETTRLPIYNQLTGVSLAVTDALAQANTRSTVEHVPRPPERKLR
jgi:hypothetical protein